jgi:hypothetical protein
MVFEYVPAGQSSHIFVEAFDHVPAGHPVVDSSSSTMLHVADPAAENVPSGHWFGVTRALRTVRVRGH